MSYFVSPPARQTFVGNFVIATEKEHKHVYICVYIFLRYKGYRLFTTYREDYTEMSCEEI